MRGIVHNVGTNIQMKTYPKLYDQICSINNLANAWRNARKRKTKKFYVIEFEKDVRNNLLQLREELLNQTYKPKPLVNFVVRDPKTRKISKSAFRDRIVHHAVVRVIEPIFEKIFIYDSCANRLGKGNLFALQRFDKFKRKVSENGNCLYNKFNDKNFIFGYCLKADIKHYFQEVDREILIKIIQEKITCERTINLIRLILNNLDGDRGMPLGNLTSQFFANVYLNELDYFAKHKLKAKYYIRYADDFVILSRDNEWLKSILPNISNFLQDKLELQLNPNKISIKTLASGVDFLGWVHFLDHRILRNNTKRRMFRNIKKKNGKTETVCSCVSFRLGNFFRNQIQLRQSPCL